MTPLISVLVTLYNREQYIAETLNSILASTYRDFELIVVDDCSTDQSVAIVEEIAAQDERIRLEVNERNLGDYGNRLKTASLAQGRYLKYVDSDDLIYPHSLAIMIESMEKYPEAALGLAHSMSEDESPYPWCLTPEQAYKKQFLDRGCLNCGPTGAIIRRDVFEVMGGFDASWGVLSDTDLWLRLAAKYPVVLLPPGLVWWRRHEGQEFTKDDAFLIYLERGYQLNTEALVSVNSPLVSADKERGLARMRQHMARRTLSMAFREMKPRVAYLLYSKAGLEIKSLLSGFRAYE